MKNETIGLLVAIPVLAVAALLAAFHFGLNRKNADELPSALAGTAAPALDLPALSPDIPAPQDLALDDAGPRLVNFWASWCGPCRAEHPLLARKAEEGIPIIGVNYKDKTKDGLAFLAELGNPYVAVGQDASGRVGIDWGLYGVPETFVIDAEGQVLLRHPGPITQRVWDERFAPLLDPAS